MILCISHSGDFYTIDIVINTLRKLGKEVVRLNSDTFSDQISFHYTAGLEGFEVTLTSEGKTFSAKDIEAVWYRKLWKITVPEELDECYSGIFQQEYSIMRNLFFESIPNVFWMNPMALDHRVSQNKLEQLRIASSCGIDIPESIFTNDAEKVQTFFHEKCHGNMIAKLHGSLSRSMKGDAPFFPTTLITEDNLIHLDSLCYCPMIFQRMIPKEYELRIIYVDGIFFTGKIDATASETGKIDWRAANDLSGWEKYTLPPEVCSSLTNMMLKMGLFFGAIDMIRQKDGRYIFLEVNPQGEWGMLQRDLDYPIGEAIAEKLVSKTKQLDTIENNTVIPFLEEIALLYKL
ncbi:MvdC/MvdD family ATP grasp protein [Flavobacterium sp. GT3R68]|uniref:MvdC/MvdD family ATP grasp protein n=1 Tax=Flavobacterium sp. GT3R68 TaxID=2594437 RepID=UPI000F88B327|nr:ATP-grasp ribosomal peptide maturase [Flavobacterium sp. GT3R68]RTY94967.1 ATP-grasp ribosomal peptide maturase [Flavobacterium sp. GSN2]TRW91771.1 ATP-grasp ribosomal peptide maturase [Flavobacterium sp. GT3R68]